jgi:predicted small metal-binding protein
MAAEFDDEATAELYFPLRQPRAKIVPTRASYNDSTPDERSTAMAKQITCECGQVIRGDTDGDVMSGARDHMRVDHPELLDKVTDADLLGWIEEV